MTRKLKLSYVEGLGHFGTVEVLSPFSIGRSDERDLTLENPSVSRRHCTIYLDGDEFFIRDDGSKNGTFLNGSSVGDEPCSLKNGDELSLAGTLARVVILGDDSDSIASSDTQML